jgi:class 3 adenylate cyclase
MKLAGKASGGRAPFP